MTVQEAFKESNVILDTKDVNTVEIGFINNAGHENSIELDLTSSKDRIKELEDLWASLYEEIDSAEDAILYIDYIQGYDEFM